MSPDDSPAAALAVAFQESIRQCQGFGYVPSYFMRMLEEHGAVGTARQLLGHDQVSEGFTRLWNEGRLELTVEAIVLRPEFHELFTASERRTAQQRLTELGA